MAEAFFDAENYFFIPHADENWAAVKDQTYINLKKKYAQLVAKRSEEKPGTQSYAIIQSKCKGLSAQLAYLRSQLYAKANTYQKRDMWCALYEQKSQLLNNASEEFKTAKQYECLVRNVAQLAQIVAQFKR